MKNIIRNIGTSVNQKNMALLEKLTIPVEKRAVEIPALKNALGVEELVYLATCNRVEMVVSCPPELNAATLRNRMFDFFLSAGRGFEFTPNDIVERGHSEAIRHTFRVVSALESMVIGETQITGQFKSAVQECEELGLVGPRLKALADEALLVAKRVRNGTRLGLGSLSMASLVILELERMNALRPETSVALVGSGEMSTKMANHLKSHGVKYISFVNRTLRKAEALAKKYDGTAISLEDFQNNPGRVDIIMSATSATEPIFTMGFLEKISADSRKLICVDLAIPRDFSTEFRSSELVTMIDVEALHQRNGENLKKKFIEIDKAEEFVEKSVRDFQSAQIERALRPALRESFQKSLDFSLNLYEDLLETRFKDVPPEIAAQIKAMVKKIVGHSSAEFSHAVSAQLSKDFQNSQPTEHCEHAKRVCLDSVEAPVEQHVRKATCA